METNEPQTEEDLLHELAVVAKLEAELQQAMESDKAERDALAAEEAEAERVYREIVMKARARKAQLDEIKWEQRQALRKAQQEKESLERRIQQAAIAKERAEQWLTLEKRWDMLTMGAPWREWAKDHQLEGASKIVYEGGLILADPMGLGKTLTAIIAMDKIRAATKDASYDNPIEFGSMK